MFIDLAGRGLLIAYLCAHRRRSITSNAHTIYALYIGSIYAVHWIYMSCTLELYPQQPVIPDACHGDLLCIHSCTVMRTQNDSYG